MATVKSSPRADPVPEPVTDALPLIPPGEASLIESGPAPPQRTSLLVRTTLVLAVGAAAIVLVSVVALYLFMIQPVLERSADDEAALIVLSAQTWVELPPEARPYFELEMAQNHDLILSDLLRELPAADAFGAYEGFLVRKLSERLDRPVTLSMGDELYWIDVEMGGHALQIGFAPDRRNIQPLYGGILITVFGAAVVFLTALFIVTRITRPLSLAATRAESFRGAEDFEPLPESGPRELASLARNFNTMAREIAALLSNRTTLLAGISHDLRTPITRMRLAVELLPESVDPKLIARFERNLEAMDALISDALHFARGAFEGQIPVDLAALLADQLGAYDTRVPLRILGDPPKSVRLAPSAFRRVMANLVGNALQYGTEVRVELDGVRVRVVDSGPGIPAAERDKVFRPFYRLDQARSLVNGSSGLGLSIVKQLCQAHGWEVRLDEAPGGGTVAEVDLDPRSRGPRDTRRLGSTGAV